MKSLFPRGWKRQIWDTHEQRDQTNACWSTETSSSCLLPSFSPNLTARGIAQMHTQAAELGCTSPPISSHLFSWQNILAWFWIPRISLTIHLFHIISRILFCHQPCCLYLLVIPSGGMGDSQLLLQAAHAMLRVEVLLTCSFAAWFSETEDITLFFSASLLKGLMCF